MFDGIVDSCEDDEEDLLLEPMLEPEGEFGRRTDLTEQYGGSIVSGLHLVGDEEWEKLIKDLEDSNPQLDGPCPHLPGTMMKVVWMALRYQKGLPMRHPEDPQHAVGFDEAGRRSLAVVKRNGWKGHEWGG